jgi:hypothetical protein
MCGVFSEGKMIRSFQKNLMACEECIYNWM